MKKIIVTTTINPPTTALLEYSKFHEWELIIVGDKKTPKDFYIEGTTYLAPELQEKLYPKMSELLGWNTIQRRNIGFLHALEQGGQLFATVDDDNIPMEGWESRDFINKKTKFNEFEIRDEVFDPIGATNYNQLWHRGFPPQLISRRDFSTSNAATAEFDIDAGFWNGDPDIDAFCRMEHAPDCNFNSDSFPFSANKPGPFNSQNTIISRNVLKEYFMFPFIGRMDDIWASYYVQSLGFRCLYTKATVRQERNVHDLTRDMVHEFLGYEKTLDFVNALQKHPEIALENFLPQKSKEAFDVYRDITRGL